MKIFSRLLAAVVLLSLATGCASTKQFAPLPNQGKRISDPTKTRIYVIRPTSIGGGVSMKISDNGQQIGKTGPLGYLCWERPPGSVEVSGKAENTSKVLLDAKPGEVYYIQQHMRMGILFARNKLRVMHPDEGREKLRKCSPPKRM